MALTRLSGRLIKDGSLTTNNLADESVTMAKFDANGPNPTSSSPHTIRYLNEVTSNGSVVTITGTAFVPGTNITIGGVTSPVINVLDANTITFVAPELSAGTHDGYMIQPDGKFRIIPSLTYA